MAAQFAPFETVDSIPHFLNKPFSWAMTMGELSVSAMIPNFIFGASGESSAETPPAQPRGSPARSDDSDTPVAFRNFRREIETFTMLNPLAADMPALRLARQLLKILLIKRMNVVHV